MERLDRGDLVGGEDLEGPLVDVLRLGLGLALLVHLDPRDADAAVRGGGVLVEQAFQAAAHGLGLAGDLVAPEDADAAAGR